MPATILPIRRYRPNLDGGRPTDLRILGFEGAFEGLVAETDDAKAISAGLLEIIRAGSVQAMTIARIRSTRVMNGRDDRVLRACSEQLSKVASHLRERSARLEAICIPEERRIAHLFDAELSGVAK